MPREPSAATGAGERTLWLAAYVALMLVPFAFMVVDTETPGRTFVVVLSAGLGFAALTVLALQLVMPSRAKSFTAPFGIDVLLRFHRQMGIVALGLVLAHIALLMVEDPDRLALLNPIEAPWRARAGALAVVALVGLLATSLWRRDLGLGYEAWRLIHVVLGLVIIGASLWHVLEVGKYVAVAPLRWAALGFVLVGAAAVFYLRVGRPFSARARPYRVDAVKRESRRVTTVRLVADGHPGVAFTPGQFAWLKLARTPYALTEHPFSFSSSAERPHEPEFSIQAVGDFTARVAQLRAGEPLLVDGPHGSFRPHDPDAPYLLVVAGIGVTPAMSLLRTLADRRDPRPVVLVYGNRTRDEIAFGGELEVLGRHLSLTTVHVLSQPPPDWRGYSGRIDRNVLARVLPPEAPDWNVLVCGPPPMVDAAQAALLELGIPASHIHAERFAAV